MENGASSLSPYERLSLGAMIADGKATVSGASRAHGVSRKFARRQRDNAMRMVKEDALRHGKAHALVVDEAFMERFVVAAALSCNCPFRGIMRLAEAMFGFSPSIGTIHNICRKAVVAAATLNSEETMEKVRHAAIDEIFQNSTPVFAGVDLASLYVFLLSVQPDRSGTSWWCALEQCREAGFTPASVIGDGGLGLRKGMAECFPQVPCDSDVFHALKDFLQVLGYLEKKALGAMGKTEELIEGRERLSGYKRNGFNRRIAVARRKEAELVQCHAAMETIYGFLREDVLDFNEMPFEDRLVLFNWLMEEMAKVEGAYGKIPPLRKKLERQAESLLAVFARLDRAIVTLAGESGIDTGKARMMVNFFNGRRNDLRVEEALAGIVDRLGLERAQEFLDGLYSLMADSFRASSAIEDMNSVLRMYFQQRREIGHGYLELLRFYLNHRIIDRSRVPEREGKSAWELLTGESHAHWLDMLGFTLTAA